MEAAGLACAVASLASLFQTAVACFEHVQIQKNFGTDYQTIHLRLVLAQLQLTRWGEAVGLNLESTDRLSLPIDSALEESRSAIEATLGQIVKLFEDAEQNSAKYGKRSCGTETLNTHDEHSSTISSLRRRALAICRHRQQQTGRRQKLKWAVYDKDYFEKLVEDAKSLVDALGDIYPPERSVERQLCDQEAIELCDARSLPLLQEVQVGGDKALEEAITRIAVEQVSDTYRLMWTRIDLAAE